MFTSLDKVKKTKLENPKGGTGSMEMYSFLDNAKVESKTKFFNLIELEPESEVGYHQHINDEEIYYIVSGKGEIKDNDEVAQIKSGDFLFTGDKNWHSIKNTGNEKLVFIAVVVGL